MLFELTSGRTPQEILALEIGNAFERQCAAGNTKAGH
nr:hypothetical protein [Solimonas soli]